MNKQNLSQNSQKTGAARPKSPEGSGAKPKSRASIAALIIGILALIAGVAFLIFKLTAAPGVSDAEFLVKIGAWQRQDVPSVVWNFTEIGKGELTTNSGQNNYGFIWALDGNQLKIETDWLYTLDDNYTYHLDQGEPALTLTDGETEYTFVPQVTEGAAE